LERIFNLVGADVRSWYDEMPKPMKADYLDLTTLSPQKGRPEEGNINRPKIDEHFRSTQCLACGSPAISGEVLYVLRYTG
jgi:DNA polymerase zeta